MARLSPLSAGLALFVVLFALDFAATEDKCRSGCQGVTPSTFKYADGTTYKYNLESSVDVTLSSAEGQQTSTKLKATVLLTQQPQCNQVIRLQGVQIIGSDGKKHGTIPDIDKPIKINFHDGHVEDVICAEHGDTQQSLNIKRAVASLFQAAIGHDHETDVFGVCPTEIQTSKAGNLMTITKSRVLNRCSHREHVKHDFMATAFNLHSEIKSSPILKSDYINEMRVKEGILDHVLITETYLYIPFSVGKNGARATVQTKLQFVGKSKDNAKVKCSEPKSILFEDPHPTTAQKADVTSILQAVRDTSNSIGMTVSDKTAGKFSGLIKIMAAAKKDDLLAVYNQVRSGAGFSDKGTAKKVFLDALFRSGTGECLEVAIELLKNKELSAVEQKLVYLGMSFVTHATPSSMTSAATLLDIPNLPREAYLGIGTLAARYCKSHDCKNVDQLNKLTQKLVAKLKDGKAGSRQQEDEVIAVLKALRNMRHLIDAAVPKITAIAQDKKSSMRVRSAALDAFLADACKDKIRDSAIGLLKDIQQDSEIRIKAYLALAQCPNGKVANVIKTVLDNEPSYQVGGFIVSHIRNLRASANPDKELARRELANVNTMKRFPVDPRKYSFNNELSYAFNTLGLSSSAENNIIYSQNSFLPRVVNLNLTAEVFGHSFNFLEVDVRQENLDKLMEHYLGPLGVLRSKTPDEVLKDGKARIHNILAHLSDRERKSRGKRQAPKSEIDNIAKQVQIKSNEPNHDLDYDMSVKLFGSELLFLSINEQAQKYTPEVIIDKIFDSFDKGVEKAKNFDHTITTNNLFLDAELSYPTSMGVPIRLAVEGTSSVQLKAAGGMDLHALINRKDTIVKLSLIPSADIELAGRLLVDAGVFETGLKVVSNLHTATGSAIELEIFNDGEGIDAKLSLPIEKQQLVSARHEIVFASREAGTIETIAPIKFLESKDFSICFDHLSPLIGLTACADINGPNYQLNQGIILPFPLSGNSKFGVWIEKDFPVTYHIRDVVYSKAEKRGFEFVLETLDDKKQRKVSFLVEAFATPEMYIKATLDSPIKKAVLEGRVIYEENEHSISAKFQHDNQEYSGKLGVAVAGSPAKQTYTPLIEYIVPGQGAQKSPYTVEGVIIAEVKQGSTKYTLKDVKLIAPNNQPIKISGNLGNDGRDLFIDITVSDGTHEGSFKGDTEADDKSLKVNAELKNNLSPVSNFKLSYEIKHDPAEHSTESTLNLVHGTDSKNKLHLHNSVTRKFRTDNNYKFSTKNKFSYPVLGIEAKLEIEKVPRVLKYELEGKYNNAKVASKLDFNHSSRNRGDYDLEFEVEALENKVEAKAKREIDNDIMWKSKIENTLEINDKKIEVTGTVSNKIKPNDIDVGAVITIKTNLDKWEPLTIDHKHVQHLGELKAHLKVSRPSTTFVDFDLTAAKQTGANGHLKVDIPDVIKTNGEIKSDKWVGKANLVTELNKLQRKVKLESTFNFASPNHNVAVTLYPNYEKDPKKISVTSDNVLNENAFTSRNNLIVFGQKLEVQVEGGKEGNPALDGKLNGEIKVILPNEMYFGGKLTREVHIINGVGNGNMYINLEQRKNANTPGMKLTLKGQAKDVNVKEKVFDLTYDLAVDDSNGKTLNGDLAVKRWIEDGAQKIDLKGKLAGSILPTPAIELIHTGTHKDRSTVAHIKLSAGNQVALLLDGAVDLTGKDKPLTGSFKIELKSPEEKLKSILFSGSGSILDKEDNLELTGATKFFINDGVATKADLEADAEIKLGQNNGQIKGNLKLQQLDPMSIALGYGHTEENGITKCQSDLSLQYATGKNIKGDLTIIRPNKNEAKVDLKLDTPFEHAKSIKINHHSTRSEDKKQYKGDLTLEVDGKKYVVNQEISLSEIAPQISSIVTLPDGKVDKFIAKINKISPKHFTSQLTLICNAHDLHFDNTIEAKFEKLEDLHLTLTVDAPKLNLDKVQLDIKNEQNKSNKVIEVVATSNGKNLLKGSCAYKTRDEGDKYIAEGSGEFTVKEQKKTGNFKLSRHVLSFEKNGEQGVEISFDAGLGNKAIDAELKLTNKQFRILNSYCEEKKQCAHFEVDSKTNTFDVAEYNHELEVNVDLRKLGLAHEFGLKAVTIRKQFLLDHTVDVHFQSQENNKYQYSLYLRPKEAGVSLTTPKRQVSLEGHVSTPTKDKKIAKGEIALYLNKKAEPTKKSALTGSVEYVGDSWEQGTTKAEIKLTAPALTKDLSLSHVSTHKSKDRLVEFTTIFDIFNKPNHKLVITGKQQLTKAGDNEQYGFERHGSLKSQGMGVDITYDETTFYFDLKAKTFKHMTKTSYNVGGIKHNCMSLVELSPTKYHSLLKLFDKEIYNVQSTMKLQEGSQVVDTEASAYGLKPIVSHFELKDYNRLKYTLAQKETPNHQLIINAGFTLGMIADFRAEVAKNELVRASVKLDEANFLKTDYGMSTENIKKFVLEPTHKEFANAFKESKTLASSLAEESKKSVKHLGEVAKKNVPNVKPVADYYGGELQKVKDEIAADKTVQQITEVLRKVFSIFLQATSELTVKLVEINEDIIKLIESVSAKIASFIETTLEPRVKEIAKLIIDTTYNLVEGFSNIGFTIIAKINEFFDAHQAELKQLATSISEITKDVGRFLYMNYERVRDLIEVNLKKVYEEIKALPLYEELKARYEMIMKDVGGISEPVINMMKDALNTLKDVVPNEDIKHLISSISDYLEKKLRHEKVDDLSAIKNIVTNLVTAIKKIMQQFNVKNIKMVEPSVFSVNYFNALPKLVAAKFSPLSRLVNVDDEAALGTLQETLYGVSFNPRSWVVPFRLYAFVVQGQHIFTFDGKHVTFPGKCNYLLARDAVNGNFTIAGTYTNGLLTAITVADKTDSITIKKGGQAMLNKDAVDFPIRRPQLEAYRLYESVNIASKAGVNVHCDPQLTVCTFSISGFYHGQLRGLLGNGNHEPYDDFTMANGKIVTSESDFGNSYKMQAGCAPVKTVDHASHHHHAPACNELFSATSSMRFCFPFVNIDNFRMACDHGVAAGVKDTEHAVALGYVAACNAKFIPIRLPTQFVQCKNSEEPRAIDDKFSVSIPAKAADIIIIVDQIKENEPVYKELVQPLVTEITKELAGKGITDVEFHLIGYGGEYQKYPSHFTNGGKLSWKGKLPQVKFSEVQEEKPYHAETRIVRDLLDILRFLKRNISLVAGCDLQSQSFIEAMKYPFRAHATKTVLAFTGAACEQGEFLPLQRLRALIHQHKHIHINLVTPFRDFKVKDAKVTKSVIGFNKQNVFTFADAKKNPEGNSELHKDLEYNDFCVDYTIQIGGNVFVTDNFLAAKGAAKKQFSQVVSHNLVDQIVSTKQGLDCKCKYAGTTYGLNQCTVVATKEQH